jgi:hypothetical protein
MRLNSMIVYRTPVVLICINAKPLGMCFTTVSANALEWNTQ